MLTKRTAPRDRATFTRRIVIARGLGGLAALVTGVVSSVMPERDAVIVGALIAFLTSAVVWPLVRRSYRAVAGALALLDLGMITFFYAHAEISAMEIMFVWPILMTGFLIGPDWALRTAVLATAGTLYGDLLVRGTPLTFDGALTPVMILLLIGYIFRQVGVLQERMSSDLRRQERGFRRLSETATQMARLTDPDEVMRALLDAARDLTDADASVIVEVGPDGCEVIAVAGFPDWVNGYRYARAKGTATAVADTHEPRLVEDYADHPDAHPALRRLGVRSTIDVPLPRLRTDGAVLKVARTRPGDPFRDTDLRILQALAGHATAALQKATMLREERRVRVELERADRLKDEFLTTVSHELRTPLTVLGGFLDTLVDRGDQVDPKLRADLLRRCSNQADRLRRLVLRLLSISQAYSRWTPEVRAVDLDALVERVVDTLETAKPRTVEVADAIVLADPEALEIALHNLLENAGKHGDPTSIDVRTIQRDGHVQIIVSDEGQGIRPEELDRLFERFQRGSDTLGIPGLGVGLALVKDFVEAMGGAVAYEPNVPVGSRFAIALPRAESGDDASVAS